MSIYHQVRKTINSFNTTHCSPFHPFLSTRDTATLVIKLYKMMGISTRDYLGCQVLLILKVLNSFIFGVCTAEMAGELHYFEILKSVHASLNHQCAHSTVWSIFQDSVTKLYMVVAVKLQLLCLQAFVVFTGGGVLY